MRDTNQGAKTLRDLFDKSLPTIQSDIFDLKLFSVRHQIATITTQVSGKIQMLNT